MAMTEYFDSIHFCPFTFFALESDNYIYQLKNYPLKYIDVLSKCLKTSIKKICCNVTAGFSLICLQLLFCSQLI